MALTFELSEPQALAVGFNLYNLWINVRPEASADYSWLVTEFGFFGIVVEF